MTFLTVVTRTFRRPEAFRRCAASLAEQAGADVQHIVIRDDEGVGIPETYRTLRDRDWSDVTGEYVYFLDDDNVIWGSSSVRELSEFSAAAARPDMIIFKADLCGRVVPEDYLWMCRPQVAHIDLGCVALRVDAFFEARRHFGYRYEGDYDYILSAFIRSTKVGWWDKVFMRAQRVSRGEPEHVS
jgi:hypothetical protein